jgi:predicted GNAT family acetyltransferase
MDVVRIDDPASFLDAAERLLLADEARHNLILGLAGTLRDEPGVYPEHGLWLVRDGSETVGAALRTPPHNLVLASPTKVEALEALADALDQDLPGIVGSLPEAEIFAELWAKRTGLASRHRFSQGIYALERVRPVSGVAGGMRRPAAGDRPLLVTWWRAFVIEALHEDAPDDESIGRSLDHRLGSDESGLVLWQDDGPVSFAGFGGRTPNGIRIGPVYTPPGQRGHGYASALVAALSESLLAAGRRFCFLYTDMANPTANAIYRRIGYEFVCESTEIGFER